MTIDITTTKSVGAGRGSTALSSSSSSSSSGEDTIKHGRLDSIDESTLNQEGCALTSTISNSSNNSNNNSNNHTSYFNKRRKSKASAEHFNTVYHQYNKCFQNYYHCYQYLKPNCQYVTSVKPSVNHWQLRDLLKFNQSNNQVYYTKDDAIYSCDLDSFNVNEYIKFNYYPRCFDHVDDYIVTGGLLTTSSKMFSLNLQNLTYDSPNATTNTSGSINYYNNNTINSLSSASIRRVSKGLFSFYNPELKQLNTVKVGEMINNDVTLYKSSNNHFQSYICNNDTFLYCLDINQSEFKCLNKINCEPNTSLNNVVKNPQSEKILTATGDSSLIFLIDPTMGKVVKTIDSKQDSGFTCAYHSSGMVFNTVHQNGVSLIYDLRMMKDVVQIHSTRPGHQSGAFRAAKFSNDLNDLLIISEHVGRVHIIDLRKLNNVDDHQVIVLPAALNEYIDNDEADPDKQREQLEFNKPLVYDYLYAKNNKLFNTSQHSSSLMLSTSSSSSSTSTSSAMVNISYSPTSRCEDLYQQSSRHLHGELELLGIEFTDDSKILIGCQDSGMLVWDVNSIARRSIGSCDFV